MQVLKAKKIDRWVKAEFIAKRFPEDYGWGVLAGIEEIRWELNLRGFEKVQIYLSGGLDEKRILTLNPVVDAYGVGTSITN